MKRVHVIVLGGTITYQKGQAGNKGAEDLISSLPAQADIEITREDFLGKASSSLTMPELFATAKKVRQAISDGADGVIVAQGTDTIEETAFLLDLLPDPGAPVIVTGAMRHQGLEGWDGGANLLASVTAAASDELRGSGCCVVFSDEIHSARFVQKRHTQNIAAFRSQFGPVGYFTEGRPRICCDLRRAAYDAGPLVRALELEPAPVYQCAAPVGEDGRLLGHVIGAGYRGMVIEGMGGGHVSDEFALNLDHVLGRIPVVMSSRTGAGEALRSTYEGYPGSEGGLLGRGVISAGILTPAKARILLCLLVTAGLPQEEIKRYFGLIG